MHAGQEIQDWVEPRTRTPPRKVPRFDAQPAAPQSQLVEKGIDAAGRVTGAVGLWSNPVNALFVNGTVICGSADMPEAVRETCRERFLAAGAADVVFIDDGVYQHRGGNVHCATNARRE